jgi:serine/threonine protein kinase
MTRASFSDGFSADRFLGKGGFSRVYLGITRRKQLTVAIKLLNADEADPETLDRQVNYEIDQVPNLPNTILHIFVNLCENVTNS